MQNDRQRGHWTLFISMIIHLLLSKIYLLFRFTSMEGELGFYYSSYVQIQPWQNIYSWKHNNITIFWAQLSYLLIITLRQSREQHSKTVFFVSVVWLTVFKLLGRSFLVIIFIFFNVYLLIWLCWVLVAAGGIFYLSQVVQVEPGPPAFGSTKTATGPPGKSLFFSVLIYPGFLFILNIVKDFF